MLKEVFSLSYNSTYRIIGELEVVSLLSRRISTPKVVSYRHSRRYRPFWLNLMPLLGLRRDEDYRVTYSKDQYTM